MNWTLVLLLTVGLLVGLLLMGIWIPIVLGSVGIIVLLVFVGPAGMAPLSSISWNISASFVLTCVPLFILMGEVVLRSKLSDNFYNGVAMVSRSMKGSLLHANIISCSIFAAVSGSSVATAAAIGVVAIPEMLKRGYGRRILFGSVASGGTLGILIPPSVPMIIYAAMVEQSVGKLFIGGILPGILLAISFMVYIWIRIVCNPRLAPSEKQNFSLKEQIIGLIGILPIIALILLVMGSIWLGYATPTEAAALGATCSIVISALSRRLSWSILRNALVSTVRTTCMVIFIMLGAQILSYALVKTNTSRELTEFVVGLGLPKWVFFAVVILVYIFLGCIIDGISMLLLTLPILYPIIIAMGFDPIWFGIVLVIMIELGQVTPPVGVTMFVVHGVAEDSTMSEVVWGSLPFATIMIATLVLLSFYPSIVTWLPSTIIGR
jgi:C4-dicarboxylate transporter DctM subunit